MKRIMLACSAGMSTSLLVTKMEAAAKEQNLDVKIWAIPEANLANEIENCDVVLLGPQVRFMLSKATEIAKPFGISVEVINMMHYGTCNGAEVLKRGLELAK
ncbi:PTS sugar transporter subunit IIB [Romboutsia sp.]|uniref:PTS sugar transporter subunit IIB n=1 Tax=Romboutsia sp. TaxID=1965302 RepID=UPI003F3882B9